jgi:hypothetical protein
MNYFLSCLLGCLLAGLSHAKAQTTPAKPASAKKAAAKAAMAAKPTITTITPRGLHNGMEQQLVITGKELANATVQFADARLKPAVDAAASSPTKLVFKVKVPADLPRGGYEVTARTAQGETAKVKLFADDIAPTTTTAVDFKAAPVAVAKLPASLWGTLTEIGQHDAYRFTAKAGEELVLDLAVAQVGSTAKSPTLEIMDTNRAVLAVNRGLDSGSDPFLAWKAPADGDYHVLVSNTTMDGSADLTEKLPLEKQHDWSSALAFTDKAQLVAGRIDGSLNLYEFLPQLPRR